MKLGRLGRKSSRLAFGAAALAAGITATAAWAAEAIVPSMEQPDWLRMGISLFGGLALFLYGMDMMSDGLRAAAADGMKKLLGELTRNRFFGAITGALVTIVLNSSSVTTVLVVGFITAGLMSLAQSIGVIMGANVGTTFTAQIIAFKVTAIGLPLVAVGFFMKAVSASDRGRSSGVILMGLGLIFFGIGVMSEGMEPLRSYQPCLDLMARMENPLLGILVGAVFTGLVQSSSATTGIAIVLATDGLLTLPAGIALALGANIGTCVTAVLASIGKPVAARRAAAAHVLFNVAGVALWLAFIPQLAEIVRAISPAHPNLAGMARMGAEVPRQIANAHTVFNLANTTLFIGFTVPLARFVEWLIPEPPFEEKVIVRPRFLDRELVRAPAMALQRVRMELGHVGEIVQQMYADIDVAMRERDRMQLDAVAAMDDQVDVLEAEILEYLREIRRGELTEEQSESFVPLMTAANELEGIGDVLETDVVALGRKFCELDFHASDAMKAIMRELYSEVGEALVNAVAAARDEDEVAAQAVLAAKPEILRRRDIVLLHQAEALTRGAPELRLLNFRMEMEFVENLKRIYGHCKRIAKSVLPEGVAGRSE